MQSGPRLQGDLRDYLDFVTLVESCGLSKAEGTAWIEALYRTIYKRTRYRLQSIKRVSIKYPEDMFPNTRSMKPMTLVFLDLIDVIAEILTDASIVGKVL